MFDGASNASSTLLTSPVDTYPFPLPREPTETLSGDTTSVRSGVSGLSFGLPGSPVSKCNSDFGFPTTHGDLTFKEFASRDSLNYSTIDAFPSSASINLVPSIPSITSDLHLHNFPISNGLPFEPHSVYFSAIEGDLSMSLRSDDGLEPVHETSGSSISALDLCIPSAEEAHHQIFSQENPSPRRRTVRIEVRNDVLQQGAIIQESYTYACKSLPYDAGFRPHAYVDNREHATHGKNHLEAMAEDLCAMAEFMEEEDHVTSRSKSPAIFRKLGGKRLSKLMTFGPLKFKQNSKRFSTQSCAPNPHSPAVFSSVSNFANRSPVTANYPNTSNCIPTTSSPSPPPSYPIPDKKSTSTKKIWSGPRLLSIFVVPKPKIEGRVVPSPKELSMCLPAGENLPPLSPLLSPQMHSAEIPQTDVHGMSYGPSRVASPELPPMSPDPSVLGRKEHRSWLTNIRSPVRRIVPS